MENRYKLTFDEGTDKAFAKEYTEEELKSKKDYINQNYKGRYKIEALADADINTLNDSGIYTLRMDKDNFSKTYTGADLKSKFGYLEENYAGQYRVESTTNSYQDLNELFKPTAKESLNTFLDENNAFLRDFERRDKAERKANRMAAGEGAAAQVSFVTPEERQKYAGLHQQEESLKKAWYGSEEWLEEQTMNAAHLAQMRDDLNNKRVAFAQNNPILEGNNPYATRGAEADKELQMYETASRIMDDTIKLNNAPDRYQNRNFWKKIGGFFKGSEDTVSDVDLWTAGLTETVDNFGIRDVLSRVQKELGNLNNLSEEDIENILTPAEKAVLQAWAMNAEKQMERSDNLALAYQAGQGATESLAYMAEFALTGGVGKVASEGVETMAKWLGKKALTGVGGYTDDVAAKMIAKAGEKALGKYGMGLVKSVAEAAGRTGVMPSTFRNISEKATEIKTDENGNNYLVSMNDAFAKGFVDSFIENLSEGGRVNAIGDLIGDVAGKIPAYKKMVDKLSKTKMGELYSAFSSSGIMNTLRGAGWHGLGEEYLEEWYGNTLRTITGIDKSALKEFAAVDNQIITLTSFLPMTLFGGTIGTFQVLSAKKDLDKKAEALRSALIERGYDEKQAANMIDMMRGATPSEVSSMLTPIVNSVAYRNENEAAALMRPAGEFAWAVNRWQSFNTKYQFQEQEQRDGLRAQMEETLGQFWQQDENGRQTVQRGVNEKGEVVYMLDKPSAEDVQSGTPSVPAVTAEGKKVFVNPNDYQLEGDLEINDFLGNEIMAEKGNQEQARMAEEKDAKIAHVRSLATPGLTINLGTAESPIFGTIMQKNADGAIVSTEDGQVRQISYEELGGYVGVDTSVLSDAQIDEQKADVLSAERSQREAMLDQEYDNDDNAIAELSEAEDAIEQSEAVAESLPMKADGSVDQTALWNGNPERWAQWNDEQRQDGGANSLAYVSGAIAKEQAKIAELQAAYEAESDFDTRDAIEQQIADTQARVERLTAIQQGYIAQAEATAAPVVEAEPVAPRVASQMSEQEKAAMDAQHQARLDAARSTTAKREAMQNFINEISRGSVPMTLISMDEYEQVMKDAGCTPNQIAQVKRALKVAKLIRMNVPAFFVPGVGIFAFVENIPNIEQLRLTYVHERQHQFTAADNKYLNALLQLGLSRERLAEIVYKLSTSEFYSDKDAYTLADEVISYAMERAYTYEDFSVALQELGIEQEIIDIIKEIDNEQRFDNSTYPSRRRGRTNLHDNSSRSQNGAENDRNSEAVSGGLLGSQGDRSSGDSVRGNLGGGQGSTGEGAEVISEEGNVPFRIVGEPEEVNPAFVEAISTDVDEAEYAQFLDDKAFAQPQPVDGIQPDDVRFSIVLEDKMRGNTQAYFDKHYNGGTLGKKDQKLVPLNVTHFTQILLDAANAQIEEMRQYMLPYLDMESKGKRFLPAEVYGKSTLFDNSSYGKTMENTLICTRTLAYIDFVEEVKKRIGRPLTATESFLASQMLYDIAVDPQCLYCYASLDRKAYDEFLLRYIQQRDEVISKWNASDKSAEAKDALYKEFLAGRKPTSQMQARFESWLLLSEGDNAITPADLATKARRGDLKIAEAPEAWEKARSKYQKLKGEKKLAYAASEEYQTALWNYLASPLGQVTDAEAYAQSASWAKKEEDYRSYTGELLNCTADALKGLMGHYGLRFYSFSEYSPAFILENMQMVRDAAARGLKGFAYTKEIDFIKIFAPTGMNINCSVYGRVDSEGNVVPDTKQGADWAQVQALREQYPNVGAVFVATNDEMVEWALNQPWIDVIIPFHIVRTGADIAKFYEWTNYSSMQADTTPSGKTTYVFPHEHHNDKTTFLKIAQERGLSPRFADVKLADGRSIVEHPNYMRLVNETRRSVDETPILTPTFNVEAAKESFDAFVAKGGYYSGYFYEDESFEQGIETVVEDIKAGKTAKDVEYGRQDVPIDVAKIMAKRAEMERKHGKSGVIDLVEEAEVAAAKDVMFRFIGEIGARRMDAETEANYMMDNLDTARAMEQEGKDMKTIKMATGWERGADTMWRFEMEDFEFKGKPGKKKTFKLQDLINDLALFTAYPELKDIKVQYKKLPKGVHGRVKSDSEGKVLSIELNEADYRAEHPERKRIFTEFKEKHPEAAEAFENGTPTREQTEIFMTEVAPQIENLPQYIDEYGGKETLVHEIQHAIQRAEGFVKGGNVNMIDTSDPDNRQNILDMMQERDDLAAKVNELAARWNELKGLIAVRKFFRDDYADLAREQWKVHDEYMKVRAEYDKSNKALRGFDKLSYDNYKRLAGETEARNAARRMNMPYQERRESLYTDTQDVRTEDQIFLRGNVMKTYDEMMATENVSFRITPEQDKAYMDAVNAGDMETAQKMVIEAAKLAMPNTKVVDENGNPKVVYHGSTAMFTVFDKSRIGSATGTADGRGFYFTTDRDYALGYKTSDGQLFEVFLNIEKPLSYDKKTITKAQLRKILKEADRVEYEQEGEHYMLSNYANYNDVGIDAAVNEAANLEYDYADNDVELVGSLIGGSGSFDLIMDAVKKVTGKSGMIAPKDNGTIHYVVTDPAGIKSAEPVTYDNDGNVIPLSERFNPENADIRFRVSNENQAIFVSNAARAVEGIKQEVQDEMDAISATAIVRGNYLKAPNGADTNLTPEQWAMVRTKNFLNWFGDWINDPENASKVVDENGEPKVVFHGSNWRPILEEPGKAAFKMRSGLMGRGAYFTDNFTNAADYAREKYEWENYKEVDEDFVYDNGYITEAFLNIRNEDNIREYYGETYYLATDPNQIKSATNNTGEFSKENNDIRFRTSLELDEEFGDAWRNQQNEDGRHSTQVANTKSTYEKIGRYLEDAGMKGASILDASSGLGLGTQALREMGFNVEDVEPFPSENREAPTYSSYADIEGQYDVVISNAVLNVIPDDWRADVLHQMADAVKEGGKMIINTRPASNIAQQGVEGKTRITLDSPSEILVKRGDRIAAYQKGFTSEELAEWIKSELGEGWRVEKATKKNSGISGEGTAVVIRESEDAPRFRTTGTPTDEVVANGLHLTPAQTADVAANIFAALPEESRKKITEGLNGNILGLKDAILQIPTSLAVKENWDEEDKQMADVVAEEMTKMAEEMTRPFSAEEGLWLLYNNLNKGTDLISQASRALVQRNLGFDAETLAKQEQAKEDVRFRTVGDASSNAEASLYNRGAVNVWTRLKESFVDMQASVEELIKAIEKRSGKVAQGFENILLALNQQSSKGLAAMESYTQKFLNPMFDEIRKIMDETKMKYEDVVRYVILKHGLERNKKLAQRDARAHYQEIYDEIISKITGMTAAQKRTYLTNAQLKEGDAKAELATLQAVDMSAMTDEEKREHKKKLAAARKAVEETEEHLKRAQKIASLSEQEAQDELDKIFEKIENGTDSVFKEMRENDYSGISSMFYDQLGVDRKNFSTEEQYQAALMEAKKDRYSSLKDIETAAEAEVKSFEGKTDTKELWKRINAATKETLRQQYEANMISKDQYLNLRDMFEYYVPLRGFKENTAEDMYTYYRKPNSTGYTKPILGAEGRKTEAESPFGWIAAMAGSAIASNVKNEAKLALFYFVSNRPENGIATISKTWFVDSGEVDERGKKIFKPAYPPFSEDLSSPEGKAQYEIWQANMKELQKKGQAYEAGQRLNLGNAVVNISDANKPEHIVNVKVGGKDYTIIINGNPRAAQAINGDLNIEGTAQDYSALFGPVLRWMSSVNTSYNPEFWITNMMRDMAFTMMAVNIKEDPAYRRKFKKNYLKAFKVISLVAKNEKGTIGDSYLEQQYKDFVKYGGVTGYTQIKDSETWEHEIENYLSSTDPESLKSGKVMRGMKSAFHAAHRFGESLEQVSRFAAFLTARETGKSINEAINDAKEITVNFNRKGSGKMITLEEAKYLTGKNGQPLTKPQQWMVVGLSSIAPLGRRFIMFFNAAIQGLNATYKLMKKNPKRFTGWALGYAAVGMMNAVLHAMLDDDDDYLDIPQYERRNSLMIGGNGAYFKWALPQEARAFYALGDLAVETVMGRNPHQNFLGEALKISTEILPVNPSEGWKAFMPSVAIPFIELALNEDYKGAPIYNEQKWLSEEEKERTAKWSNAYQGTGWTYVKIAQGLNYISGGDKHDAGLINLQPEKLEHLVQSAFGGTIRTADKFISTISAAIDPEEPMTIRQAPFLNRFLTINDERFKNVHVNDVFDYYKADAEHALTLEKQYIKDRDMDSLTELRSSDEYQWAKIYGKYKKPLKAIQDKIKVADGTAEKKELMKQQDELKKRMIKEISEL